MRSTGTWILMLLLGWAACPAGAQLQVLPESAPQSVFSGGPQNINLLWHNNGTATASENIQARIYQSADTTAAPWSVTPWKKLEVLPQQTVVESARLELPAVRGKAKFVVQWLAGTNDVLGVTEITAFPTNLLGELKTLMIGGNLGVLDPANELKPVLTREGVEFLDLGERPLADFRGRLALICPAASPRAELAQAVRKIASTGTAVVWITPSDAGLTPSFYTVPGGPGTILIAQPELLAHFADHPQAQLNLVALCQRALNPEPPDLPGLRLTHE